MLALAALPAERWSHVSVPRLALMTIIAAALLLVGCTATPAQPPAVTPPAPGMGGGMGGASGGEAGGGMAQGAVASASNAILEISTGSCVTSNGVSIARVVAPADGWVVVNSTSAPLQPLGVTWVPKGESREVIVKLTAADGPRAVVSLHIDRGKKRSYEYDPARPTRKPDSQVLVNRTPVAIPLALSGFGVDVLSNSALVQAEDQQAGSKSVKVTYLLTPGPSWVTISTVENGLPTKLLGRRRCEAGEFQGITVPLDSSSSKGEVVVTVHRDAGNTNRLDFDLADPLGSADQPYRSAGEIVSKVIRLGGK